LRSEFYLVTSVFNVAVDYTVDNWGAAAPAAAIVVGKDGGGDN